MGLRAQRQRSEVRTRRRGQVQHARPSALRGGLHRPRHQAHHAGAGLVGNHARLLSRAGARPDRRRRGLPDRGDGPGPPAGEVRGERVPRRHRRGREDARGHSRPCERHHGDHGHHAPRLRHRGRGERAAAVPDREPRPQLRHRPHRDGRAHRLPLQALGSCVQRDPERGPAHPGGRPHRVSAAPGCLRRRHAAIPGGLRRRHRGRLLRHHHRPHPRAARGGGNALARDARRGAHARLLEPVRIHRVPSGQQLPDRCRAHQRQRQQEVQAAPRCQRLGRPGEHGQGGDARRQPPARRVRRLRGTRRRQGHGRGGEPLRAARQRAAHGGQHAGRRDRGRAQARGRPLHREQHQPRGRREAPRRDLPAPEALRRGVRGTDHRRGHAGRHGEDRRPQDRDRLAHP